MSVIHKQTILIVDDAASYIFSMSALLGKHYTIKTATNGIKALKAVLVEPIPDLILLDVVMPDMDGYETLRQLKANVLTRDIPVIFMTSKDKDTDEEYGLNLGAVDYLTKPFNKFILFARVATHLSLQKAHQTLKDQNHRLEELVAERTLQLVKMQDATIVAMASLAETRDNETGDHIYRVQHYIVSLAKQLQFHPRFREALTDSMIELLYKTVPLHDIGKVGVPDRILLKPGKLDADEFDLMKQHTVYGRDVLQSIERHLGGSNDFLKMACEIAYSHQEKWDGSGYPEGLKGDNIPISARLTAVVDVYDALISDRVYKAAFSHTEAIAIMKKGRATHFDPDILDAFLAIEPEIEEIAKQA